MDPAHTYLHIASHASFTANQSTQNGNLQESDNIYSRLNWITLLYIRFHPRINVAPWMDTRGFCNVLLFCVFLVLVPVLLLLLLLLSQTNWCTPEPNLISVLFKVGFLWLLLPECSLPTLWFFVVSFLSLARYFLWTIKSFYSSCWDFYLCLWVQTLFHS